MDATREIEELEYEFQGCRIIRTPEHNPTEIICELGKRVPGLDQSEAIAIIESSAPHFHKKITKVYLVEAGILMLHMRGRDILLRPGEMAIIRPGQIHSASGDSARVRVIASPSWTPEDHIPAS